MPSLRIRLPSLSASVGAAGLQVTSINRQLEVLRRMLKLAQKWGKIQAVATTVEMLSGETSSRADLEWDEQDRYLQAAVQIAQDIEDAYQRALKVIKAARGKEPLKPEDPYLLRDVATILLDCALRPEECFRLQWADVRGGALHVLFGKTVNARRRIPLTERALALLEMRRPSAVKGWVFPAPTQSGHIEKSTLKKQHKKAYTAAKIEPFTLYTFRHTC